MCGVGTYHAEMDCHALVCTFFILSGLIWRENCLPVPAELLVKNLVIDFKEVGDSYGHFCGQRRICSYFCLAHVHKCFNILANIH
mmetsp:Transcript_11442/g.22477  ORF Transcript_11442/g.22477 Transcript_11442/m.22477 type:complete len:85 (+) Transcript_11442:1153-1407(+)